MNLGGRLAPALSPISRSAIIRVNPRVARKSLHLNHRAISQLVVLGCSRRSIINYRDHSNDQQGRERERWLKLSNSIFREASGGVR